MILAHLLPGSVTIVGAYIEEFFLKLAELMEEFYFLFMIFALAVATNAAANLVKAINSARHTEDQPE